MTPGNGIGPFSKWSRLSTLRSRFLDELFHPFEDFVRIVFGFDDCFPVFFVNGYFRAGRNPETLSYLLWEDDSPF